MRLDARAFGKYRRGTPSPAATGRTTSTTAGCSAPAIRRGCRTCSHPRSVSPDPRRSAPSPRAARSPPAPQPPFCVRIGRHRDLFARGTPGGGGGRDRRRSGDLALFRRALCQLSYPTVVAPTRDRSAVPTGFEPATSGLTGRRALQTAPQDHGLPRTPNGIRTRVTGLKGRRPRPLDDGGSFPVVGPGQH